MNKMKILRVNADDFGLTRGVTDGILKSHLNGILTHTSIMSNGLDFIRAIQIAKDNPTLGIGIHLNLTWGKPLNNLKSDNTLVDKRGDFFCLSKFIRLYLIGSISKKQVEAEWNAQIIKFLDSGIKITHLDSHHHIHMLPGLNKIIKKCADKFSIKLIRNSTEAFSVQESDISSNIKKLIFLFLSKLNGHSQNNNYFKGLFLHGKKDFKNLLKLLIRNLEYGVTELMVHPGIPDAQLSLQDTYVEERLIELEALCDRNIISLIEKENILLMGNEFG